MRESAQARIANFIRGELEGEYYRERDCVRKIKSGRMRPVKRYWEIVSDNLSKAGWTWGCVATVDRKGRTIFVADAHRDNGKRFIVTADEKLRAFLELQRVTRESFRFPNAE
jgi:hypothetical protein